MGGRSTHGENAILQRWNFKNAATDPELSSEEDEKDKLAGQATVGDSSKTAPKKPVNLPTGKTGPVRSNSAKRKYMSSPTAKKLSSVTK